MTARLPIANPNPEQRLTPNTQKPLLEVQNLHKHFVLRSGVPWARQIQILRAVNGVSFAVESGHAFGLVGESGSGKTTVARTILRLYHPTEGTVSFDGRDISQLPERELRPMRRRMQMVFQDTRSSLDPRHRIRSILAEPLRTHGLARSRQRLEELMTLVGLTSEHLDRFPHQLSGGQRQRIGVARALAVQPDLIVADEPVSALDVSIQAQILNLMRRLQREFGLTYLLIAHDLGVVSHFCDQIAVMYLGKVVETGPARQILAEPQHPYTQELVAAVPNPDPRKPRRSAALKGEIPSPLNPPSGCPFHTRCPRKIGAICEQVVPPRYQKPDGGWAACHLLEGIGVSLDNVTSRFLDS